VSEWVIASWLLCVCVHVCVCFSPKMGQALWTPRSHSSCLAHSLDPVLTASHRFRVGNKVSKSSDPHRSISAMYIHIYVYCCQYAPQLELTLHLFQLELATVANWDSLWQISSYWFSAICEIYTHICICFSFFKFCAIFCCILHSNILYKLRLALLCIITNEKMICIRETNVWKLQKRICFHKLIKVKI